MYILYCPVHSCQNAYHNMYHFVKKVYRVVTCRLLHDTLFNYNMFKLYIFLCIIVMCSYSCSWCSQKIPSPSPCMICILNINKNINMVNYEHHY